MNKTIKWNDWSGFVPISFAPGLGGEFFALLMYYRHHEFDPSNFPFNKAGKFSFVNEEKPLRWNTDKSLFGWYMKSPYVNTVADHDELVNRLGYANKFLEAFPEPERFDRLSHAIAGYGVSYGIKNLSVYDDELYNFIKQWDYEPIQYDDYQFAVVHPFFRWFKKQHVYEVWKNAKAIQLVCPPSKGWIFYLLSFSKMYDYYLAYVEAGETFRKQFFDNLEQNFIGRNDNMYSTYFCLPIVRTAGPNLNVNSYDMYFNMTDQSDSLSVYLGEDFKIPKQALDYYYNVNMSILNHYQLDPSDDFVSGQEVFDRFKKFGPYYFEGK